MELRVLNYFLAVAREQSIVKAAESLHLSQPTLSTQIKSMEEELGKQLLIRNTKGSRKVTLTEEGLLLRKRAEKILSLVEKTEKEISFSDSVIVGDVYIGTGETESIRFLAKAAKKLQETSPGIHCHISSGNAACVTERLDKGLIDFGIIFGPPDSSRYQSLKIPQRTVWGVLLRKDDPLAKKETLTPRDLKKKPLILSQQGLPGGLAQWMRCRTSELNIVATYNLIYNSSLLVEEGLGYAIGLSGIINTSGNSPLCFRPLNPPVKTEMNLIWKKYQVFSRPARKYLDVLDEYLGSPLPEN